MRVERLFSAVTTLLSTKSEVLIEVLSVMRVPLLSSSRLSSEPAKSIRCSLPVSTRPDGSVVHTCVCESMGTHDETPNFNQD